MADARQLRFDGSEAPHPPAELSLGPTKREVLRLAMRAQGVTPTEVGVLVHSGRANHAPVAPGLTCCAWASSDGSKVLKDLREAGLVVQRKRRGPYYAVRP